jgi:competence protein ComEA
VNEIIVRSTLRERLEALGGHRREAWTFAAVVAAVVLGALWLWSRGSAPRIAPAATSATSVQAPAAPPSPAAAQSGVVLVHVAGAVRRPGLYELGSDARVADALRAAGGPTRRADIDSLNLAELVADGAKIEVSRRGQTTTAAPAGGVVPTPTPSGTVVDINTADAATLETIPGVGPVTVAAILDYRGEIGSFSSVDQLLEVSGIGPVTLENIRPYVTV